MCPTLRCLVVCLVSLGTQSLSSGQTPLKSVRVASGLGSITDLQSPPDETDRMFIVQKDGVIRILDLGAGGLLSTPFLDIGTKISIGSERGLLGLAFHPDFTANDYFYLNYTNTAGNTVVERYSVSPADPNVADPGSGFGILGPLEQPFSNHNAGQLQFGPDGYLYVGLGDGGGFTGDPNCRAQNGKDPLGKMLRLDVDGGTPFAIPPDNPFVSDPNFLNAIWAYGFRNPWRYSFDRVTGDLWIADVGQTTREEISFQAVTSTGGENYGWKVMEGTSCFSTSGCSSPPPCNDPSLVLPVHEYNSTGSNCAVTGGYVYRGCAIPDLQGTYFFADYCADTIWSFRYDGVTQTEFTDRTAELAPGGGLNIRSITTFGEDRCGELYIADHNQGEVFRIEPDATPPGVDLGFGKVGSSGLIPELSVCGLLDGTNTAQVRLRFAPPSTLAFLYTSLSVTPINIFGGTLAAFPPLLTLRVSTDPEGKWEATAPGGLGPVVVYVQFVINDAGASFGRGFSNAVEITWP